MNLQFGFLEWLGTSYLYAGPVVVLLRLMTRAYAGFGMERIAALIGTVAGLVLVLVGGLYVEVIKGGLSTYALSLMLGAMGISWLLAMMADRPRVGDAAAAAAPFLIAVILAIL